MIPSNIGKLGRRALANAGNASTNPTTNPTLPGLGGARNLSAHRLASGIPGNQAPTTPATSAANRPRIDLGAMTRNDRTVHTMAAGTMKRFNDAKELEKFLHEYDESMMISTFDSEEDVRKHNPGFAAAMARSKDQFAERGLKLEYAFGVDLTKTAEESPAVAKMHALAQASGIDMRSVELRFPRSNQETPAADRQFLKDMAAAQAAQGVCELVVRHTVDSQRAHGAPDGPMIDDAIGTHFQLDDRQPERDTAMFESSPRDDAGTRVSGRLGASVGVLNKSTYSRAAQDPHQSDGSGGSLD